MLDDTVNIIVIAAIISVTVAVVSVAVTSGIALMRDTDKNIELNWGEDNKSFMIGEEQLTKQKLKKIDCLDSDK
jgi:hypothetical protein